MVDRLGSGHEQGAGASGPDGEDHVVALALVGVGGVLDGGEVQPEEPDPAARLDAPVERGTRGSCRAEGSPGDAGLDTKVRGEPGRMSARARASPRPRHLRGEVVEEELRPFRYGLWCPGLDG